MRSRTWVFEHRLYGFEHRLYEFVLSVFFEEFLERTTVCYLAPHHIAIVAVRPRS